VRHGPQISSAAENSFAVIAFVSRRPGYSRADFGWDSPDKPASGLRLQRF
jgi:hypothetical protein